MSMKKSGARRLRRYVCSTHDRVGRRRRGEDDVDLAERRSELVERERRTTESVCELARRLDGAVRDEGDLGAARREVRRRELADPSCADEQDTPSVQIAEDLRRERRRRRRDGRRALADRGLGANALADRERLAEHAVERRPGGHRLVCVAHLAEDLTFAGDERVEARGDAEEVHGGRVLLQAVEHAVERLAGKVLERGHSALLVDGREVQLGAVAGREADDVAERPRELRRGGRRRASPVRATRRARRGATNRPMRTSCEVTPGECEPRDDHEREAAERQVRGAPTRSDAGR